MAVISLTWARHASKHKILYELGWLKAVNLHNFLYVNAYSPSHLVCQNCFFPSVSHGIFTNTDSNTKTQTIYMIWFVIYIYIRIYIYDIDSICTWYCMFMSFPYVDKKTQWPSVTYSFTFFIGFLYLCCGSPKVHLNFTDHCLSVTSDAIHWDDLGQSTRMKNRIHRICL